ncbi:hypothetical protein GCM10010347_64720 [Streptomyces cirratus]|uniref:Secreted protein n=1 Tax=Streptomyces cirratus TaxID=68187 RepID=A0ABQ3F5B4_9ACTN|nr:hypothetical protein GCM10010347_64720 [Streptomyces cirratus]
MARTAWCWAVRAARMCTGSYFFGSDGAGAPHVQGSCRTDWYGLPSAPVQLTVTSLGG